MSSSDLRVVITGGSSGIGLDAARRFLRAGSHVIINGSDADKLAQAERNLEGGARVVAVPGDIALPDTAVLSIELIDLALPNRPRLTVSAPTGAGQVPLAFTLTFEDSLILPQHTYALNAEIEGEGIHEDI